MPDKTFENKLNEQMGEFHFTPSDAVWQKLEAELLKRKKRRWAIIWFFSGILILSAGLYFYAPKDDFQDGAIKTMKSEAPAIEQKSSIVELPVVDHPASLRKNAATGKSANKKAAFSRRDLAVPVKVDDLPIRQIEMIEEAQKIPSLVLADPLLSEKPALVIDHDPIIKTANVLEQNPVINANDSVTTITNNSITNNKITNIPKRPTSFGLRLEAGRSANKEAAFEQAKSADLNSSPTSGGGSPSYSNPYSQSPEFAWSAGAWMRKPFNDKLSLVAGLAYHHYRTGTPVGSGVAAPAQINYRAMDITVNQYYTQGNWQTFQNNYHLLSMPLELSLQLNKGRKMPIAWMAGLEPGWMISSNALVKDSSGILYSDKKIFNRFQLGLQTGFSFRFFNRTTRPLYMGPVFQYMLTPSFKSGDPYNGHLSFIGLRADWILFSSRSKQR